MRFLLPFLLVLCSAFYQSSSEVISWKTLADVKFNKKWNEEAGMYILYPEFGQSVKRLNGKRVSIKGYVIPVDYNENYYVLSAYPYSACFFCGGAGPETVVSLKFEGKPRKYKTDELLSFEGVLKLNSTDVYEMNYILTGAKQVNEP